MGRKIKKAAVVVAAGMVIGTQIAEIPGVGIAVQAEEKQKNARKENKVLASDTDLKADGGESDKGTDTSDKDPDKDAETEGKDPDKDSETDGEKPDKDSGTEDKEPDKDAGTGEKEPDKDDDKEEIELYHVEYDEPDGENGYYTKNPVGKITHLSKRGVTRYHFENGDGEIQEGVLRKEKERCEWKQLKFADGKNTIEIWMEDEEGQKIEHSESRKEFWMDSTRPVIRFEVAGGSETWHKEAAEIQIEASDGTNGSQIAEIICKTGEKVIGKSNKATEKFQIEEESKGGEGVPFVLIAVDFAGNQAIVTDKVFIDREIPEVTIQGVQDYMITSKPVKVNYLAEEENAFQTVQASVLKEDTTGKKETVNVRGWKMVRSEETGKTGKESSQILTEDGIYKLRVDVSDMAGHENHMERQVIIDKENPVIAHVDELDGKYLKYFQWDYSAEELVKDFTSYTYTMRLDDTVYRPGEKIEKEGRHTLIVEAVDSAGNKSEARARFTIDHTPPVIRFEDIKEGESYEKERIFYVRTENPEDQIEYIKINGEKQKSEKQKGVYECKVDEVKEYEVEVKAKDLAGNERISRIGFQIEPERTFLQKITDPVRKYIFYGNEKAGKTENPLNEGKINRKNCKSMLWGGFTLVCVLTGISIWKREQLKNLLKK